MHNSNSDKANSARDLELQADLERIRRQSIEASRRGDFRLVAKLTLETARLNAQFNQKGTPGNSLLALIG